MSKQDKPWQVRKKKTNKVLHSHTSRTRANDSLLHHLSGVDEYEVTPTKPKGDTLVVSKNEERK